MTIRIPASWGRCRGHRVAAVVIAAVTLLPLTSAAFEPLPRDSPAAHGVDPVALDDALSAALGLSSLYGMVVVRDGTVIGERYRGNTSQTLRHMRSVTKSVTSTLIGIAIDQGYLPGVTARMVDYLPPNLQPSDPRADAITIEHLLTMRSGLRFAEDIEWNVWLASSNQAAFVLSRPLESNPGTHFVYSSAAVHILSVVLEEATGMTELEYADRVLFEPLGITDRRWERDRQGHSFGGHGLELRIEDAAKLGLLFARRGRWGTTRIVAPAWVAAATAVQVEFGGVAYGPLADVNYGWLWWLEGPTPYPIAIAWGWGGQFVVVLPAHDVVIATACRWQVSSGQANIQEEAALRVIFEQVIPAIGPREVDHRRASGRVGGTARRSGGFWHEPAAAAPVGGAGPALIRRGLSLVRPVAALPAAR